MKNKILILLLISISLLSFNYKKFPIIYIIGDSTVKNGSGKGENGLWGWGDLLHFYIDTTKIKIKNYARGGRSSRTYIKEGLWTNVYNQIQEGDIVLIQFGHNDGSPLNTGRERGTLRGIGNDSVKVIMESTGQEEIVYTYGYYMRKYINDCKNKKAIPIIITPVPRNKWTEEGKIAHDNYADWAKEIANLEGVSYIDLNKIVSQKYEQVGKPIVDSLYFTKIDGTHTSYEGAKLNAYFVAQELKKLNEFKRFKKFFK